MATATHAVSEPGPVPIAEEKPKVTPQQAAEYDQFIRQFSVNTRFGWWKLGAVGRAIRDNDLWKQFAPEFGEEPFKGFVDYCERRAQNAKTPIYLAMKLHAVLDHIPAEECEKMPRQNAIWLSRYVLRVGSTMTGTIKIGKEMLSKSQKMTEKEFAEYINDKLPGAAKEEIKQSIIFHGCDKSLAKVVDEAVKIALWEISLDEANQNDDKRHALERLAIFYLDSKCEHEGFKNLSNREAYIKAHKRKSKAN